MARPKKEIEVEVTPEVIEVLKETEKKILPITEQFGNGDLNVLRDKINEIIRSI